MLTIGQQIALGQHLSEYPDDKSFNQIMEMLINSEDDDSVGVWTLFEDLDIKEFVSHLIDLSQMIDNEINIIKNNKG